MGEFGKDCHIVHSAIDVKHWITQGSDCPSTKWVLQELVRGSREYSVSLLVVAGELIDVIGMEYEYGSEAYVYPDVVKLGKRLFEVPQSHVEVMRALLQDFS